MGYSTFEAEERPWREEPWVKSNSLRKRYGNYRRPNNNGNKIKEDNVVIFVEQA
jgi:hypothetical protein